MNTPARVPLKTVAFIAVFLSAVVLLGCGHPTVSPTDARLVASVVACYDRNQPPAVRWGGGDMFIGDHQTEMDHYLADRRARCLERHRQIDSISGTGGLAELKKLFHEMVANDERAAFVDLQVDSSLVAVLHLKTGKATGRAADSLWARYQSLFGERNRLVEQSLSSATRCNRLIRELALSDTIDLAAFKTFPRPADFDSLDVQAD